MPELPSVEATKDMVNKKALKQSITGVQFKTPQVLDGIKPAELLKKLKKRQFKKATRHGKYLILETDDSEFLILHFGLRGGLKYQTQSKTEKSGMMRVDLEDDHCLIYNGLYGKVAFVNNAKKFLEKLDIGPDALAITFSDFKNAVEKNKTSIKALLMDQHIVSGLGNVYVDEILFQSGIHPKVSTANLSAKQVKKIYSEMQDVLKMAIGLNGKWSQFDESYLTIHREGDGLCPRCGEELQTTKIAGRKTYFCPLDQVAAT